jgi:hypothetical protein
MKRHGTTTLFAALDVLEGKVIGQCMKRHRQCRSVPIVEEPKNGVSEVGPTKSVESYSQSSHMWVKRNPARELLTIVRPRTSPSVTIVATRTVCMLREWVIKNSLQTALPSSTLLLLITARRERASANPSRRASS